MAGKNTGNAKTSLALRSAFTIFVKDMLHSATIHKQTWWLLLSFAL